MCHGAHRKDRRLLPGTVRRNQPATLRLPWTLLVERGAGDTLYVPRISSVLVGMGLACCLVAASDQPVFGVMPARDGDDGWLCWSGCRTWQWRTRSLR